MQRTGVGNTAIQKAALCIHVRKRAAKLMAPSVVDVGVPGSEVAFVQLALANKKPAPTHRVIFRCHQFDPLCLITQRIILCARERKSAEHQYGCRAVHPCLTFAATAATAAAAAADTKHSKSKMATAVCAFAEFSDVR